MEYYATKGEGSHIHLDYVATVIHSLKSIPTCDCRNKSFNCITAATSRSAFCPKIDSVNYTDISGENLQIQHLAGQSHLSNHIRKKVLFLDAFLDK